MMQQMQHLPLKMTNSDLEDEEFRAFNPIDISGQCPGQREN